MHTQVHRFHDTVAVYVGGKTAYMTPTQARALAEAIKKTADDTDDKLFSESTAGTFHGLALGNETPSPTE